MNYHKVNYTFSSFLFVTEPNLILGNDEKTKKELIALL